MITCVRGNEKYLINYPLHLYRKNSMTAPLSQDIKSDNLQEICVSVCALLSETVEVVGIVSDDSNYDQERQLAIQDALLSSRILFQKWKDIANKSKADYEKIV